MRKLLILIICSIVWMGSVQAADWQAVNFKKWKNAQDAQQFRKRIGGEYANYQQGGDSGWTAINNNWVADGDSAYECNTSILKTRVDSNGKSIVSIKWGENIYTATSKLNRLMWLKTDTWDTLTIFTDPDWSNYSKDSNIVKWTNVFPAVDYRVRKGNGRVEHGIFFKKPFLDSAVILYNKRADSANIALANVIVYTLSANIDNADVAIGNINKRKLKQLGEHYFGIDKAQLFFPGSDTLAMIPVNHRWLKWNNKIICIEYVMMKWIKKVHEAYPNAVIWHNDIAKIDGTTNVEDAEMQSASPDYAYGGNTFFYISPTRFTCIRVKNVSTELGAGATISACVCSLYAYYQGTDATVAAYRVFKPWVEGDDTGGNNDDGDLTWNDWASDANEWTTGGCGSADDEGSDNSGDGTGADRKATAEDTENVTTVDTWYAWDISAALAQDWYDGTANENGVLLSGDGLSGFRSTEYESNQPFWVFTYSTGEAEAAGQVIMIGAVDE